MEDWNELRRAMSRCGSVMRDGRRVCICSWRRNSSFSRMSLVFSCSSWRMRSVGGGSAATCSGESASAVWSFVTVCSSYTIRWDGISTNECRVMCGRGVTCSMYAFRFARCLAWAFALRLRSGRSPADPGGLLVADCAMVFYKLRKGGRGIKMVAGAVRVCE